MKKNAKQTFFNDIKIKFLIMPFKHKNWNVSKNEGDIDLSKDFYFCV